jgi:hypothetical protein
MRLLPITGGVIAQGCLARQASGVCHDWHQHATDPRLLVPSCGGIAHPLSSIQVEADQWLRRCRVCERLANKA